MFNIVDKKNDTTTNSISRPLWHYFMPVKNISFNDNVVRTVKEMQLLSSSDIKIQTKLANPYDTTWHVVWSFNMHKS